MLAGTSRHDVRSAQRTNLGSYHRALDNAPRAGVNGVLAEQWFTAPWLIMLRYAFRTSNFPHRGCSIWICATGTIRAFSGNCAVSDGSKLPIHGGCMLAFVYNQADDHLLVVIDEGTRRRYQAPLKEARQARFWEGREGLGRRRFRESPRIQSRFAQNNRRERNWCSSVSFQVRSSRLAVERRLPSVAPCDPRMRWSST